MAGVVLPASVQPQLVRPLAYRILTKKFGLNIKSDGLAALAAYIGSAFGLNWRQNSETTKFLEQFAGIWREQGRGLFVDELNVLQVINEIKEREKAEQSQHVDKRSNIHKANNLDAFLRRPNSPTDKEISTLSQGSATSAIHPNSNSPVILEEGSPIKSSSEPALDGQTTNGFSGFDEQLDWTNYFKVIPAFEQQNFNYDHTKRQYIYIPQPKNTQNNALSVAKLKLPNVNSKVSLFTTRYHIIKDKVSRNETFQDNDIFNPLSSIIEMGNSMNGSTVSPLNSASYMKITQIKNLLGHDGKNFLLLGLLDQNSKGNWNLEDPSGSIELDIKQAIPTKGTYYVPGCIVLVEGIYYTGNNTFVVSSITHPPGEKREETIEAIGNLDLLGAFNPSNENYVARLDTDLKLRLHYLEQELSDHKFVILGGDIFLDEMSTMDGLKKTFDKLSRDPPVAIVFNGSFVSVPVHPSLNTKNVSATVSYKNNFDALATLLSDYEELINDTHLIFIPGPNDPWISMIGLGTTPMWPQKNVPSSFTQKMNRICRKVHWGSNPSRIAYLSQEIVLARDDLASRFKRYNITFPALEEETYLENVELQEQYSRNPDVSVGQLISMKNKLPVSVLESRKLVKTLLDQQHLSPFSSRIRPTIWDLDFTLQLSPLPSSIMLCDTRASSFEVTYNGCKTINPGKFIHKRAAKYVEFYPSSKLVVEEEIPF
ncbi:unnamed protein product [Kluyveromyces dobzhanskii CBS 2104]|uniref:DNA polymerase epsilon subunit B n=1 Tax=Kluyveromyces dobzhanskii CBS 2104 TaxID=1427455 RepID=A0A0A8L7U6_9SACH|nr:unnamed protein product [Kluyveromyces dobzhanskii CBS 2104]